MNELTLNPRLVKPRQAAEYLALSERKLWQLQKDGIIPAVRLGRLTIYDKRDLDNFILRAKGEGASN